MYIEAFPGHFRLQWALVESAAARHLSASSFEKRVKQPIPGDIIAHTCGTLYPRPLPIPKGFTSVRSLKKGLTFS